MDLNRLYLLSIRFANRVRFNDEGIHYMCIEVTLTGLYQKTKQTDNGQVPNGYRTKWTKWIQTRKEP